MLQHLELSLCTAILSGHREHDLPPLSDVKSGGFNLLGLERDMHIHWGLLEKDGSGAASCAVVLLHFPGLWCSSLREG